MRQLIWGRFRPLGNRLTASLLRRHAHAHDFVHANSSFDECRRVLGEVVEALDDVAMRAEVRIIADDDLEGGIAVGDLHRVSARAERPS